MDDTIERLRTAQIALAALMVHDGISLGKTFQLLESEIKRRLDGDHADTMARARELVGSTSPSEAPHAPVEAPAATQVAKNGTAVPEAPERAPGGNGFHGRLLPTKEAAAYIGREVKFLSNNRSNKTKSLIPYKTINGHVVYQQEVLDKFLGRLTDPKTDDGLASNDEAAEILGLTPRQLELNRHYNKVRGADLLVPFQREGYHVRYRKADLAELLVQNPNQLTRLRKANGFVFGRSA